MSDEQANVIISLHDVHPASAAVILRQREALRKWGVSSVSHLVIPQYHHGQKIEEESPLCEQLSQWQSEGDELVLHGFYHDLVGQPAPLRDWFWRRFYTSGEAEFLSLSEEAGQARWQKGIEIFRQQQWKLSGFIAPAWLLNPALLASMEAHGFQYTVLHREVISFAGGIQRKSVPTLCWSTRAAWRRVASLRWNDYFFKKIQSLPVIRISLHPGDCEHAAIWSQIERTIRSALDLGYRPITYHDYATG